MSGQAEKKDLERSPLHALRHMIDEYLNPEKDVKELWGYKRMAYKPAIPDPFYMNKAEETKRLSPGGNPVTVPKILVEVPILTTKHRTKPGPWRWSLLLVNNPRGKIYADGEPVRFKFEDSKKLQHPTCLYEESKDPSAGSSAKPPGAPTESTPAKAAVEKAKKGKDPKQAEPEPKTPAELEAWMRKRAAQGK